MKQRIRGIAQRAARAGGFELVRRDFYSPMPLETPSSAWDVRHPMVGVAFDTAAQLEWLKRVAKRAEGWVPPTSTMYGAVDAEVLLASCANTRQPGSCNLGRA